MYSSLCTSTLSINLVNSQWRLIIQSFLFVLPVAIVSYSICTFLRRFFLHIAYLYVCTDYIALSFKGVSSTLWVRYWLATTSALVECDNGHLQSGGCVMRCDKTWPGPLQSTHDSGSSALAWTKIQADEPLRYKRGAGANYSRDSTHTLCGECSYPKL